MVCLKPIVSFAPTKTVGIHKLIRMACGDEWIRCPANESRLLSYFRKLALLNQLTISLFIYF